VEIWKWRYAQGRTIDQIIVSFFSDVTLVAGKMPWTVKHYLSAYKLREVKSEKSRGGLREHSVKRAALFDYAHLE
jgi:hypothetical protein